MGLCDPATGRPASLGVGGSSAIFSVLEGVVLRPLAAPQPEQLVRLYETVPGESPGHGREPYSTLDYLDLAKENGAFESVAAVQSSRLSMTVASGPEQLPAAKVTASFFATLNMHPALGRGLSSKTDYQGAAHEVVLTFQLWKREFSGDPRILGQTTTLNTIVALASWAPARRAARVDPMLSLRR